MDKIFGICSRNVMAHFELIKSNTFIRIVRIYIFVTSERLLVILGHIYIYICIYIYIYICMYIYISQN